MVDLQLLLLGAYIVGSIPTGYLFAYAGGIHDIRRHGSGNIGATNVARILGAHYFVPVFVIDALKALLYLRMAAWYGASEPVLLGCAITVLVGNGYSLFLHFTGGKGFATVMGIMWFFKPCLTILLFCLWITTFMLVRTVGIASATTCLGLVVSGVYLLSTQTSIASAFVVMGLWGIWRHLDNIKRFLQLPID
ncbi:MAG: glycerol-3-phosphate acyltransferase [Epsilonproteobacteria bacterium]|nr:glycerol-3-phosphate acyltransferase [Campylobacterota bacterium]